MRYFHRTSISPDTVLSEGDRFFASWVAPSETGERRRIFAGTLGRLTLKVGMEGGHYTRVTVETDQVGESELDKLAKRFLAVVHAAAEPGHQVRGAY